MLSQLHNIIQFHTTFRIAVLIVNDEYLGPPFHFHYV